MHILQNLLWAVAAVSQVALLVALGRTTLRRLQPTFYVYVSFECFKCAAVYIASLLGYREYFWTFWATEMVALLLATAVIQDLTDQAVQESSLDTKFWRRTFQAITLVACVSAVMTALLTEGLELYRVVTVVLVLERTFRLLQVMLLVPLLGFAAMCAPRWKRLSPEILVGLVALVTVNLIAVTVRWSSGSAAKATYSLVKQASEILVYIWWLWATLRPAPETAGIHPRIGDLLRLRSNLEASPR